VEPTQEQLPGLVEQALVIVRTRLGAGPGVGTGLYDSILNQLVFVHDAVSSPGAPDQAKVDSLLLDIYAARELETSDPELADLLFAVHYLVKRRWHGPIAAAPPPQPPVEPDLSPLLAQRIKGAARPQAIVATATLLSGLMMGFLSIVVDTWIVGRLFFIAFALLGLGCTGWLIALLASGSRRRASLLDAIEHRPESIERIYGGVVINYGFRGASMREVATPESEHMSARRSGWYVVITRNDATPFQRRFGLNLESIPVGRDELLPLLAWLRSTAPAAAGPPDAA
jgi:hypothetical protein